MDTHEVFQIQSLLNDVYEIVEDTHIDLNTRLQLALQAKILSTLTFIADKLR